MAKPKYNDLTITLRLPAELAALARRKANRERRPLAEILRERMRGWLADKPPTTALK